MSYKNDSYLVIANKFGSASGDAKAQLFETYDKLRDLTVSGSGSGTGFEMTGNFLYRMASLLAPSSFATIFGASESMNIPGTSYASQLSGSSAFGTDALYNYSGFPGGGAAPIIWGLDGYATGGASSIVGWGTENGVLLPDPVPHRGNSSYKRRRGAHRAPVFRPPWHSWPCERGFSAHF